MKWKNNIVILVAYFIGRIYGLAIDEQFNNVISDAVDFHNTCLKGYDRKNTNLEKRPCKCPDRSDIDVTLVNNPKLVPLNHNIKTTGKRERNVDSVGEKKIKRETIKELLNKRRKTPTKTLKLLSTEKPFIRNANKYFQKKPVKSKTSGLFSNNKQTPRIKDIGERIKDFKARMSTKPRFQARGAFSEPKSKDLIKQLQDKREEILRDLKTLHSKSTVGKDSKIGKETVGSTNHLQNQIDSVGSGLKDRLKQKAEERKVKSESILEEKKNEAKEVVGEVNKKLKMSTETPKSTSPIPEIILGQTESAVLKVKTAIQKENLAKSEEPELSNKKIESVSSAIEKMKEKQKEAVLKIMDKLSIAKNKSKNLEADNSKAS